MSRSFSPTPFQFDQAERVKPVGDLRLWYNSTGPVRRNDVPTISRVLLCVWAPLAFFCCLTQAWGDGGLRATAPASSTPRWNRALYHHILAKIHPPTFPDRQFSVTAYGAIADGTTNCRFAFERAIEACHKAGGGTVQVAAGTYICNGSIRLLSNVNLHVQAGAVVRFGLNPADYLVPYGPHKGCVLVRYEGVWIYNYEPLIYAIRQRNIAITGRGIFGGGRNRPHSPWLRWYKSQLKKKWADRKLVRAMANHLPAMRKRVMGPGYHLMPEFCDLEFCRNILISGVTFRHSPFWTIHPCFCSNVTIQHVLVHNNRLNMDDGIDLDSSQEVLVQKCHIRTDDDNIVIKSGKNADGWAVNGGRPTENVVIQNNWLSHNIGFGSEMSGGIRDVCALNNTFGNGANIIFMKWGGRRGGFIRHIYFRGITAKNARSLADQAVNWAGKYKLPDAGFAPDIRDWSISRVKIGRISQSPPKGAGHFSPQPVAAMLNLQPVPMANIRFSQVKIQHIQPGLIGFWFKNAADLHFHNVRLNGHPIVNLHPSVHKVGGMLLLRWRPNSAAAGYAIYINGRCVALTHDRLEQTWQIRHPRPSAKPCYFGVGMISKSDRPLLIQNVPYAFFLPPATGVLRKRITMAEQLFAKVWHAPATVPAKYGPPQRSISNLYYWIHAARLVLDNRAATNAMVNMTQDRLNLAIQQVNNR